MKVANIIFGIFISTAVGLFIPEKAFCQTEKLGTVGYSAPKGWTKTDKDNIVAFSKFDQATGTFCIITLYGATPGTGKPESDFKREWANLVVKNMKAEPNPETESTVESGWTATAGGSSVDSDAGKAFALLTVISGGGRTVSILSVFNDQSFMPQMAAFSDSIELGNAVADVPAAQAPANTAGGTSAPLRDSAGRLIIPMPTRQLTVADLVGEWGQDDGINTRYVYRDTGTYAGADSLHYSSKMTITAGGGYHNDFFGLQNGRKIKEDTSGTVAVEWPVFFIKQRNTQKFVIRGWLELPDMTILVVCGPWPDDDVIPAAIFSNPDQGSNLDKKWVRKK